jgi:heat shock protein HslJ
MRNVLTVGALTVTTLFGIAACGSKPAPVPLIGTTWQLLSIESMSDEQPSTTIEAPAEYTVTFGDDGKAGFRVDCNRGNSTWTSEAGSADSGSLSFGPIALTKMMCPQPSNDAQVAAALDRVRSYLLSDGKLHLSLEADSGIMHWEPLPADQ